MLRPPLFVLALLASARLYAAEPAQPAAPPPKVGPLTLAVAPFTATSPRDDWMAEGLAHALSGRLYELPQDNALTLRQVAAAMRARHLTVLDEPSARIIAREVGADTLVFGRLTSKPTNALELSLIVLTGEAPAKTLTVSGSRTAPVALERAAAKELAAALGLTEATRFVERVVTTSDAAWAALFQAVHGTAKQSLSPRAADASVPSTLSAAEQSEARQELAAALKADPTLGPAHALVAILDALAGDTSGASAALEKAKGGQGPLPALAAVFVAMRRGDFEAALGLLQRAVDEQPGFLHARGTLGQLYAHLGRFREARATFAAYVARAPRQPWAHAQLGYALSKLKKIDEAVAATEKALALSPDSPELLIELASRYIDAQRYDDAQSALLRAQQQRPRDARLLVRLGYVHLLRGDEEGAIQVTEKGLRHASGSDSQRDLAYAHLNMARAWGRLGQFDVALEQLELARQRGLSSCDEIEADELLAKFRADPRYKRARF